MNWTTLISPESLAERLDDETLVLVDCRFSLADTDAGRSDFEKSHIQGARYAHLDEDLSGTVVAGVTGRHPLPEPESLASVLSSLGISNDSQVVVYDDSGGAIAARLWWLLKRLGHTNVAVLDGAWTGWLAAGYPVSSVTPAPTSAPFLPRPPIVGMVDTSGVETMNDDSESLLVDSRAAIRYRGEEEPIDPIAGHIPWAVSSPWENNLGQNGRFRSPEELRERFLDLFGPVETGKVIFHCGSGVTAIHNIIAVEYAGLGSARLYAGSWSEWITDPDRPITNESNEGS